jgi:hypothetical protein
MAVAVGGVGATGAGITRGCAQAARTQATRTGLTYQRTRVIAGVALSDPYLCRLPVRSTRSNVNGLDPRDLLSLARAVRARSDSEVRRSFVLHVPGASRVPIRDMTTARIPRID